MFEYEAAEENEMALVEGEVIEQIEQVDDGKHDSGLFPVCIFNGAVRMVVGRWSWWDEEWLVPG